MSEVSKIRREELEAVFWWMAVEIGPIH
jgi:hypothetical protein